MRTIDTRFIKDIFACSPEKKTKFMFFSTMNSRVEAHNGYEYTHG